MSSEVLETTPMYRVCFTTALLNRCIFVKRKNNVKEVILTSQAIVKQQQSDEIRAIYGCGPYRLSNAYKEFEVEAVKWHTMETKNRMMHVANFKKCSPSLEEHFNKPVVESRTSQKEEERGMQTLSLTEWKKQRKCKGLRILTQNDLLSMSCFSDQWYLV